MAKRQDFEKAMERLEKIVDELEAGELVIDSAMKKFEEGVKLSAFCSKKLDEMEKRMTVLLEKKSGELSEEPLRSEITEDEKKSDVDD